MQPRYIYIYILFFKYQPGRHRLYGDQRLVFVMHTTGVSILRSNALKLHICACVAACPGFLLNAEYAPSRSTCTYFTVSLRTNTASRDGGEHPRRSRSWQLERARFPYKSEGEDAIKHAGSLGTVVAIAFRRLLSASTHFAVSLVSVLPHAECLISRRSKQFFYKRA